MSSRVAFYGSQSDIPEDYRTEPETDNFFNPDYNLPEGGLLRLIVAGPGPGRYSLKTARWGKAGTGQVPEGMIERSSFWDTIKGVKSRGCVVLLSGFYVWKNNREKEHPFFVRLLNKPILPVAGMLLGEDPYASIIVTGSNPLIQPMSDHMPLILDSEQMNEWLNKKEDHDLFVQEYKDPFLLTDFSVVRVSKKVNDLSNNDSSLIQPIPK